MKRLTRIIGWILKRVLPGKKKVLLRLANNNKDKVILKLKNAYCPPSSPLNLVSLALLNNHRIYYNNKKEKFYEKFWRRILTLVKKIEKKLCYKAFELVKHSSKSYLSQWQCLSRINRLININVNKSVLNNLTQATRVPKPTCFTKNSTRTLHCSL